MTDSSPDAVVPEVPLTPTETALPSTDFPAGSSMVSLLTPAEIAATLAVSNPASPGVSAGTLSIPDGWTSSEPPTTETPEPSATAPDADNESAPLAGLLATKPGLRKNVYYGYASALLIVSFGPDVIVAETLTNAGVDSLTVGIGLASAVLLKIGIAFGFVAAANVTK